MHCIRLEIRTFGFIMPRFAFVRDEKMHALRSKNEIVLDKKKLLRIWFESTLVPEICSTLAHHEFRRLYLTILSLLRPSLAPSS